MNCGRALTLLATGGPMGRWRARRHASRCGRCAAEAARLGRIAHELAEVEPLSPARRALWTSVTSDPRPSARRIRYRPLLLAGAAVAAAWLALGLGQVIVTLWKTRPGPTAPEATPIIAHDDETPRLPPTEATRDLDEIESGLRSLSRELTQLRRRAELLDERKAAAALSQRLERSDATRGS